MAEFPVYYDMQKDELLPVTQEWIDRVQRFCASFGAARRAARSAIEIRDGLVNSPPPELQAFLDAWKPEWAPNIDAYVEGKLNAQQKSRAEENHGGDSPRMGATEGQQSRQDSRSRGEGVQQSGRGQGREAQKEIAVAYAVTVDGWIEIRPKVIRNDNSPMIIWMFKSTWESFATHADERGLFYIPCQPGRATPEELRLAVNQKEIADGS